MMKLDLSEFQEVGVGRHAGQIKKLVRPVLVYVTPWFNRGYTHYRILAKQGALLILPTKGEGREILKYPKQDPKKAVAFVPYGVVRKYLKLKLGDEMRLSLVETPEGDGVLLTPQFCRLQLLAYVLCAGWQNPMAKSNDKIHALIPRSQFQLTVIDQILEAVACIGPCTLHSNR